MTSIPATAARGLERGIVARSIAAGCALREAATDDDVFDLGGIDAGALDRMTQPRAPSSGCRASG